MAGAYLCRLSFLLMHVENVLPSFSKEQPIHELSLPVLKTQLLFAEAEPFILSPSFRSNEHCCPLALMRQPILPSPPLGSMDTTLQD